MFLHCYRGLQSGNELDAVQILFHLYRNKLQSMGYELFVFRMNACRLLYRCFSNHEHAAQRDQSQALKRAEILLDQDSRRTLCDGSCASDMLILLRQQSWCLKVTEFLCLLYINERNRYKHACYYSRDGRIYIFIFSERQVDAISIQLCELVLAGCATSIEVCNRSAHCEGIKRSPTAQTQFLLSKRNTYQVCTRESRRYGFGSAQANTVYLGH
jgi:hypothetical protein